MAIRWSNDATGTTNYLKEVQLPYNLITSINVNAVFTVAIEATLSELKRHALIPWDGSVDGLQKLRTGHFVYECTNVMLKSPSYDLCFRYYKETIRPVLVTMTLSIPIESPLQELDEFMYTSKLEEASTLLDTLSICLTEGSINFRIFRAFSSNFWRQELLLYALASNNTSWNSGLTQRISKKIHTVVDIMRKWGDETFNIENILEFLLRNQKNYCFDIIFLIDVFTFITECSNDFDIKYISNIPIVVCFEETMIEGITLDFEDFQKIIYDFKLNKIKTYYGQRINVNQDCQLEMEYLSKHSLDVINYLFLDRQTNLEQFTRFAKQISLLHYANVSLSDADEFLFTLLECDANVWESKLIFFITQKIISREFPRYDDMIECLNNNNYSSDISIARPETIVTKMKNVLNHWMSGFTGNSSLSEEVEVATYATHDTKKKLNMQQSLQLNDLLSQLYATIIRIISNTDREDWKKELNVIMGLMRHLDDEQKIRKLINALKILKDYNIRLSEMSVQRIFWESTAINIEAKIHNYAITTTFPGANEKKFNQLIAELEELNEGIDISNLKLKFQEIDVVYKKIKNTSLKVIQQSVRSCKETKKNNLTLAMIKKAAALATGFEVRDIQFIAILLMLSGEGNKGKLAQIKTGEGKTLIIAMLAAFFALKGHKVDIITSSPELAIPQSQEYKKFYSSLGLTVSHNCKRDTNVSDDYKCDIVYGTHLHFQGDILQNEFRKEGGREGRALDIALIDEVDNMLIDGHAALVQLSTHVPGMDQLEPLLGAISWNIDKLASTINERDGNVYVLQSQTSGKTQKILINKTKEEYIIENVESKLRILIRDGTNAQALNVDEYPEIKIPSHLREFVTHLQLKKWIKQALKAKFGLNLKQDYIIRDGRVRIVDAADTGVVQTNMVWSDGLHQFLQIEHKLEIRPESLVSNYLSNVGFFSRYCPKIYGLSGTLGSHYHIKLLEEIYQSTAVIIPPFKTKQYKELSPIVVNNKEDS